MSRSRKCIEICPFLSDASQHSTAGLEMQWQKRRSAFTVSIADFPTLAYTLFTICELVQLPCEINHGNQFCPQRGRVVEWGHEKHKGVLRGSRNDKRI